MKNRLNAVETRIEPSNQLPVDFENLLNSLGDIYFVVNRDFVLMHVNDNIEKVLGYTKKELLNQSLKDILIQLPRNTLTLILKNRAISTHTLKVVDKEGKTIYLNCKIRAELFQDRLHFVGIARDYTEFSVSQRKLKQRNKEILALAKTKELFLASMSHEIRTPLNGIMGLLDILLLETTEAKHLTYLETIKESSSSLLALVNDILDLAKMNSGMFSLRPVPTNLEPLLNMVYNLYHPLALKKDIKLILHYDSSINFSLLLDGSRLLQVIGNLVSNAIKFTNHGGEVSIGVSYQKQNLYQGKLEIRVKDTGLGISEVESKLLFKLFSQVDNSENRTSTGSGLGLHISNEIIGLMGGGITFVSEPQVGTEFTVSMPVEIDYSATGTELSVPNDGNATSETQALPNALLESSSILLVDDNEINLRVAKALFEKAGQMVTSVVSGFDALGLALSSTNFDILFMDIQMPGLDGYSLFQLLAPIEHLASKPKVALTAFAGQDDITKLTNWGFDEVMVKPITLAKTQDVLTSALSKPLHNQGLTHSFVGSSLIQAADLQNLVELLGNDEILNSLTEFGNEVSELILQVQKGEVLLPALLHSVKGTSSTLGLKSVFECAKYYENKLKKGEYVEDAMVLQVLRHISEVSVRFALNFLTN